MARIPITQPSMALNAKGIDWKLQFSQTMEVSRTMSVEHMLGHSANMSKGEKGGMFALAINCHSVPFDLPELGQKECGFGFKLNIGKEGLGVWNTKVFSAVKGCFKRIYLISCGAAQVSIPGGYQNPDRPKLKGAGDGQFLCSAIADTAETPVWAPEELQYFEFKPLPYGEIQLQGKVLIFQPKRRDPQVESYDRHMQEYLRRFRGVDQCGVGPRPPLGVDILNNANDAPAAPTGSSPS